MNESDPHFRIGALTEALESAKKRCERHMPSMPAEAQYVLRHIAEDIEGSLRRDRERAAGPAVDGADKPSEAFYRWQEHVRRKSTERVVHRIDGDPTNNDPVNLQLLDHEDILDLMHLQGKRK
jgi:hypothetical protein